MLAESLHVSILPKRLGPRSLRCNLRAGEGHPQARPDHGVGNWIVLRRPEYSTNGSPGGDLTRLKFRSSCEGVDEILRVEEREHHRGALRRRVEGLDAPHERRRIVMREDELQRGNYIRMSHVPSLPYVLIRSRRLPWPHDKGALHILAAREDSRRADLEGVEDTLIRNGPGQRSPIY